MRLRFKLCKKVKAKPRAKAKPKAKAKLILKMPENRQTSSGVPIPQFEATYLTSLECESCCKALINTLTTIPNTVVSQITFPYFPSLGYPKQARPAVVSTEQHDKGLFSIISNIQPSKLVKTVDTDLGKDTILRGSSKSSAVAILEDFSSSAAQSSYANNSDSVLNYANFTGVKEHAIRGLVRIVSLPTASMLDGKTVAGSAGSKIFCDLTLSNVLHKDYVFEVYEFGDLRLLENAHSNLSSVGDITKSFGKRIISIPITAQNSEIHDKKTSGDVARFDISSFVDINNGTKNKTDMEMWELIGRSLVIRPSDAAGSDFNDNSEIIAGVIARSAGAWENTKQVCACSGKTVWEERRDALEKNIV